jgi:mono/diheme cytochrome c family protein
VLRGIDTALELLGWSLAAFFVVLLFAGPQVVAEDKPESRGGEAAGAAPYVGEAGSEARRPAAPADSEAVFTESCGSCHTLSAAGTSGTTGPDLEDTALDAAAIETIVRDGSGDMPAFGDQLSDDEIRAVAEFVASN